jgi:hypothetical protein
MMMQTAVSFVRPSYVSIPSYVCLLLSKQNTQIRWLHNVWNGILPGGQAYGSINDQVIKSAMDFRDAPHDVPLEADVSCNYDNNSKKYFERHRSSTSIIQGTRGAIVWTTRMIFVHQELLAGAKGLQTDPDNWPTKWRKEKPIDKTPLTIFYSEEEGPGAAAAFKRPDRTPSDSSFQQHAHSVSFEESCAILAPQLAYEHGEGKSHNAPQDIYEKRGVKSQEEINDTDPNGGQGIPHDVQNEYGVWVATDNFYHDHIEPIMRPKLCYLCLHTYPMQGQVCTCGTKLVLIDEIRAKYGNKNVTNVYRERPKYDRRLSGPREFSLGPPSTSSSSSSSGSSSVEMIESAALVISPASAPTSRMYMKSLPNEHVNPGLALGSQQVMDKYGTEFKLIGKGGRPGGCRYFIYSSPDLGAVVSSDIDGYEDFLHLMALLHESKMFMELVLQILELMGKINT